MVKMKSFRSRNLIDEWKEEHILRLVAVQCAIPCVSSLTVALIRSGSVDASGKGVTVMET